MCRKAIHIFCGVLSIFFLLSCAEKPLNYYTIKGQVHGTYYTITYGATSECLNQNSLDSVFHAFDASLSTFVPTSIISRVNENDPTVVLDSLFITVFEKGQYVSRETNGAFDMTVASLVNVWGFGFKKSDSVTPEIIDSLKQYTGYQKVKLVDGKVVKEHPNIMLDGSAIAKGYSCDVVARYLKSIGLSNYMVEIGGEVVTSGLNSKGKDWHIGITRPDEENSFTQPDIQMIVSLTNCGLATSGNYRQFYYKDGKRYSHTVNPATGYPVEHNLLSASVVAPDCMTADAFATAFMVMGLDRAYAYASSHPEMAALFIYSDEEGQMQVKYTDSFAKYVQ